MPMNEIFDPVTEAAKIAFDRSGNGEPVLLVSGFPQTRRSWDKLVTLLSPSFDTIAADLPSFGDSALLPVPATTENVARIFHEFVAKIGAPIPHRCSRLRRAWVCIQLEFCCSQVISSRSP